MNPAPKHPVYLLFGDYQACRSYVMTHDLTPSRWIDVWEPEQVARMNPLSGFYRAKRLLGANTEAVALWRARGGTFV